MRGMRSCFCQSRGLKVRRGFFRRRRRVTMRRGPSTSATAPASATAGFMLESTDMILDDLLREVEARRVVQEHVEGLRRNAQFIIDRDVRHDPAFFSFVDDVAKEMRGVADKLKPPCRNFAQLRYALQSLKTDVNALRDRDVVLSTPRTDLPSPGPAVILATGAGPSVEPLAVDEEEEVPAYAKTLALDEDDEEVAASEKTLALDEDDEEVAASEKTLALEEKAAASEKQKAPALEEKAAASENEMTLTNADPEAHAASVATADAFLPGSTDGPAPDAAGVDDDDVA
ncbi:hypothetical protein ZWY2020_039128 [Hordeum vulgare]|nr:hypothetical protein ZWY2020_039128 [Hordeum vulgare]